MFAGMKDPVESLPAKLLKGWMKMRENSDTPVAGSVVPLRMDVTREDILREAAEAMGIHLNAGERGILAVINTAGSVYRGRIDSQDSLQWENMFKNNVMGCLRTARAFIGLLRPTRGRLILLGSGNEDDGLTVFTATRNAVQGCADALRKELRPYGVNVVTLDSRGVPAEALFKAPIPYSKSGYKIVLLMPQSLIQTPSCFSNLRRGRRPHSVQCRSADQFRPRGHRAGPLRYPTKRNLLPVCAKPEIPSETSLSIVVQDNRSGQRQQLQAGTEADTERLSRFASPESSVRQ